jgi:hypothetical protein
MGEVYLAEDTRLGRQVALKFLPTSWSQDTKALDRFRIEARAASSLSHHAICAIFDIGQDGDTPFIVMEALKGTTLRDRILKGALKVADVLEIGIQLADALEAAHTQGIVHRDIKPANIFLGDRNRVKVLDFGLAKLTGSPSTPSSDSDTTSSGDGPKSHQMTQPGTTLGTVSYMSPEQARGEPVDSRTDLFSLGAVLYEMVTGVQAFGGSSTAMIYDAILNRAPRPISSLNPLIPARLETVIATALEKDRDLRYQHASDLQAELKRVRRDLDAQSLAGSETVVLPSRPSAPVIPVTEAVRPRARVNWPVLIGILVAGLGIAAAAAFVWPRLQPSGERADAPANEAPAVASAQPASASVNAPPAAEPGPSAESESRASAPPAPTAERQAAPAAPVAPQPKPRAAAPPETLPSSRVLLPAPAVTPATPPLVGVEATTRPSSPVTPSPATPPPAAPVPQEEVKQPPARTPAPAPEAAAPTPAPAQTAPGPPRAAAPPPVPPAATPVETDDAAIRRVIRVYEQAIETKDIGLYRSVRTNLTRAAETVLTNSFRQIDSQEIDIRVESLRIDGRTASARLVRRDTFMTGGRREIRNSTQTMKFQKTDAGWLIAE